MATTQSDGRGAQGGSSPRKRSSSRSRARTQGERRPLQGRDTGYRVGGGRRQHNTQNLNPRIIIVGIVGILLIIALIFGMTSCIKGCSSSRKKQETTTEVQVNPDDKRVAFGVPTETTTKLGAVLDRNEAFASIAKNADKITDERLIDLAIAEPEAIEFVAGSVDADGSTQAYGATVPQGEYPLLYAFDTRWGYLPYADGILGVTGSGPVALSMASMGLSGKTTYDPSTIAQSISNAKLASGTTGMDDSFLVNHAADAGLVATIVESSSDGIYSPLAESQPVVIKLKADSGVGSNYAHWALVTRLNSDNSITVYDPTSAIASSHSWSLGAIASRCDTAYMLSAATGTATTSDTTSTTGTTDTSTTGNGEEEGSY